MQLSMSRVTPVALDGQAPPSGARHGVDWDGDLWVNRVQTRLLATLTAIWQLRLGIAAGGAAIKSNARARLSSRPSNPRFRRTAHNPLTAVQDEQPHTPRDSRVSRNRRHLLL